MRHLIAIFLIFVIFSCQSQKDAYKKSIKDFQYHLNIEYASPKTSPLEKKDLKNFKTLPFFPINKKYKVVAQLKFTPNASVFEMKTTTTELQLYKKYAVATFTIHGKKQELSLYQSQDLLNNPMYKDYLFLPFKDLTSGKTTYGGGRFIDLKLPKKGKKTIEIDFNKAYNPYCAYNHHFSCPIPPEENKLSVKIEAGVKI